MIDALETTLFISGVRLCFSTAVLMVLRRR